ncbi:hypothetical protein GHT06_015305 [Daphnia sinensis]|uniref:JmjC domain-containing protein n=1 Tax=Daphnia sinensis TaxID=1820382 RepID=A0AAD5KT42_9CRUS|nr:hypothetical protein GHT06_015305 [Daphnia sinensis]
MVHPHSQAYEQHCEGFFLITDKKGSACSYENFVKKCEAFDSQKTGHLDFRGPTVFWNQMFRMFRGVLLEKSRKKGFPLYVIGKDFSLFPKETTFYWDLTPLNKTFTPFLKEQFRDLHNPDNMMPGINTCQLLLGHAMSFTGWHTENVNLPSINCLHSGKPKYWVVVAEKHGELLKAFFRKSMPSFYKKCRAAELSEWDYIITFLGAFHFVVNSGLNVAQATNFAFPEWLPFAKAWEGCTCMYSKSLTAVSSSFNL